MQRRIIMAATALAAALAVPAVASATDKEASDRASAAQMTNRDQTGPSNAQAVGGPGSSNAAVGQMGGTGQTAQPVVQVGSAPTGQQVGQMGSGPTGQGGGDGTTPTESAMFSSPYCAPKGKTPKDDTIPSKLAKNDAADDKTAPKLPKDDDATLEDELREQQETLDRLTDLLNDMQQRYNDVIRSTTGG